MQQGIQRAFASHRTMAMDDTPNRWCRVPAHTETSISRKWNQESNATWDHPNHPVPAVWVSKEDLLKLAQLELDVMYLKLFYITSKILDGKALERLHRWQGLDGSLSLAAHPSIQGMSGQRQVPKPLMEPGPTGQNDEWSITAFRTPGKTMVRPNLESAPWQRNLLCAHHS